MAFKLAVALIFSALASMVAAAPAEPVADRIASPVENATELSAANSGQGMFPGSLKGYASPLRLTLSPGTYFYPGLGACGWTNNNNQLVVAVSSSLYQNTKYVSS